MNHPNFVPANLSPAVAIWFVLFAAATAFAADHVVTDPGDNSGPNQLRAKIELAESGGGGTIAFNIGAGTVVLMRGVLPTITTNITIEGGNVVTLSGGNAYHLFQVNQTGTLTLNNLTVTGGASVTADGGAIRNGSAAGNGGTVNINHCKFLNNKTIGTSTGLKPDAGAIMTYGPLNISNSEFANNEAWNGGAISARFSAAVTTISGSDFHDNIANSTSQPRGGAIVAQDGASVTISGSHFAANRAQSFPSYGGAIYSSGTLSVTGSAFEGNNASDGGAVNVSGTTSIVRSLFTGNTAFFGGACEAGGTLMISESSFVGNGGSGTADGGAMKISGTVILKDVTISGNTSTAGGGAIDHRGGTLSLENVTISGNQSRRGGGIIQYNGGITLTNVTLYANVGTEGPGGIQVNAGTVAATNAIFANNALGNCSGAIATNSFSLSNDNTCGFGAGHDNVDPMLGPLANNGGFTQTHLPQAGSPAIDNAIGNGAPPRDQRGYLRAGAAPDVGAAEFGGTLPVTLGNISTRLRVETGENALIGGFIVIGGGPKRVLLRGIGPSLPSAGHLDDPTLELFSPSGIAIASNDNWMDAPNSQDIIDTGVPPANDLESAILLDLAPGSYTAILRGAGNTAGVGLVEAYDLDLTAGSKLANISTRGLVGTGDNVLIGGFILLGPDPQRLIVRAIGPSLPVGGTLPDPAVELRDGNGALLQSNDNWRTTQEAEIIATGIPPSNDMESAIVATLPGNGAAFTAIVRGVNNATGVALVEVYALN
jgi:hypothetical protein